MHLTSRKQALYEISQSLLKIHSALTELLIDKSNKKLGAVLVDIDMAITDLAEATYYED